MHSGAGFPKCWDASHESREAWESVNIIHERNSQAEPGAGLRLGPWSPLRLAIYDEHSRERPISLVDGWHLIAVMASWGLPLLQEFRRFLKLHFDSAALQCGLVFLAVQWRTLSISTVSNYIWKSKFHRIPTYSQSRWTKSIRSQSTLQTSSQTPFSMGIA